MHRSGGVKVGVLLVILGLAAVAYYGTEVGGVYWRKYKLEEAVSQQLGYAGQRSVDGIRQSILEEVDALELPRAARRFSLARVDQPRRTLQFSIAYSETVNLLFTTKEISVSLKRSRPF